jgi:hypothetical protein
LLRPGGRAVFCEPHAWNPGFYAQILLTPGMRWRAERGILRMRRAVLDRALRAASLDPLPASSYGLLPPIVVRHRAGAALERRLERIPRWLSPRAFLLAGGVAGNPAHRGDS